MRGGPATSFGGTLRACDARTEEPPGQYGRALLSPIASAPKAIPRTLLSQGALYWYRYGPGRRYASSPRYSLLAPTTTRSDKAQQVEPMANNQPFEIPQQFRDMAEKNVEQASAAYGQFMNAMTQAMSMWWGALPPNEMTSGFKTVQDRAVRFAKQNADAGFALASSLTNAKDVQDVIALQTQFAQSQMQTYAQQAQELGRLMADAVKK